MMREIMPKIHERNLEIKALAPVTFDMIAKMAVAAKPSLQAMAAQYQRSVKIYIHWSAGHYKQVFADYHFSVDDTGTITTSVTDLSTLLSHTYKRNSGAISIAACCAYNAHSTTDLGPEGPTKYQIEAIAKIVATLCTALGLDVVLEHVMTHAEAGNNLDGYDPGYAANGYHNGIYGPSPNKDGSPGGDTERWDFLVTVAGNKPWEGGDTFRGKAIWYQNNPF